MKHNSILRQRGSAIGLVMVLLLALSMVILAVTGYVHIAEKSEVLAEAEMKAARAAEAAIEIDKASLLAKANELRPGVPTLADVSGVCNLSTVPTSLYPVSDGYAFTRNIAVPIETGVPVATFGLASTATMTFHYLSEATVTYTPKNRSGLPMTVTMQRSFTHQVIPLFQYAIFFGGTPDSTNSALVGNGDLELNPGADFTVGGRVHSNGNIYYASNATLTFQGIVTSVASWQNSRSPNDPRTGSYGNDATFANGTPGVRPYTVPTVLFPCSTVTTNVNQLGPIEFIKMPDPTTIDPNSQDREYNLAALKILINSSTTNPVAIPGTGKMLYPRTGGCTGTGHAQTAGDDNASYSCGFVLLTGDGTVIPWRKPSPNQDTYNNLYQLIDATNWTTTQTDTGKSILHFGDTTNDRIKDYRQDFASGGRLMWCATIDVSNLAKAVDNSITVATGIVATLGLASPTGSLDSNYGTAAGKSIWNGIVYIHDLATTTAENRKAVLLINGKNLPAKTEATKAPGGGLTIVTDHSLYIVGDYNTGNTGANVPVNVVASALNASPVSTTPAYTKKPAAVMADAVTILSSNWFGANPGNSTGYPRIPVSTTVNAAILSGNVPSTNPGNYSGGAENFPRLLEDWGGSGSNTRLTIYGSMICLTYSRQANSPWLATGNYYNAPPRNWYFEPTFNNPNTLPPGTPNIIIFSNGEWVRF